MLIPEFGIGQLLGKSLEMDADAATNQVKLVVDAHEALEKSYGALVILAEGQTTSIWTADGKSVPLAAELTAKYNAALKWYATIHAELIQAAENLSAAIKETTALDETSQAGYLSQLDEAFGTGKSGDSAA